MEPDSRRKPVEVFPAPGDAGEAKNVKDQNIECDLPPLTEVIERLGGGWSQIKVAIFAGGVWFADGAELLLITSVTDSVSDQWHLSSFQRGFIVSLVFLGVLFGNLLSGPMGDLYGRKLPIVISFACIFIFSILSAVSWNFLSLGALRFLVGLSFGIGQPAYQTLASECSPTNWRGAIVGLGFPLFCIGEMYSTFLLMIDDPYMNDLHWRWLIIMGGIPAAIFFLAAFFFLNQSPLYLACCGRYEETRVVLESIRKDNWAQDVPIDFQQRARTAQRGECLVSQNPFWGEAKAFFQQLSIPFSGDLLLTTLVLLYSTIVLNFIYYGTLYALPQILGQTNLDGPPTVQLFMGAVWEMLGYMLGIFCAIYCTRRRSIMAYLLLSTISIAVFAITSPRSQDTTSGGQFLLHFSYFGIKFFTGIGFVVVYLYVAEVTPTVARTSGLAVNLGGGRIASAVAPLLYEGVISLTHNYQIFFIFMFTAGIINMFLLQLLPFEMSSSQLHDSLEEGFKESSITEYGAVA